MDIQLKTADFNNTIETNKNVVLDFYADWCGPCQTLLPIVNKLAAELQDIVVIKKVNVDQDSELAAQFNVRSIPTLVFFNEGKVIDRHSGLLTETDLREKINQIQTV
ncbi:MULTISPECIES: thioredoxin [Bizionia]|uniref:Thioredoxin n=1 Tax=Bizionia algoritergicola TaxID=291187 RepID=A0A5D0R2U8_9FLAO|nr:MULTISPECIES: thioredoxin [Bizionia]OBX23594.1 thioredoxin [Bizionia sp. APA-3]TYB74874.1 thioredoxin [Bizionia algoritergicola]